jgi:hypothetical protein
MMAIHTLPTISGFDEGGFVKLSVMELHPGPQK